jgi:hypothetical protein
MGILLSFCTKANFDEGLAIYVKIIEPLIIIAFKLILAADTQG